MGRHRVATDWGRRRDVAWSILVGTLTVAAIFVAIVVVGI